MTAVTSHTQPSVLDKKRKEFNKNLREKKEIFLP